MFSSGLSSLRRVRVFYVWVGSARKSVWPRLGEFFGQHVRLAIHDAVPQLDRGTAHHLGEMALTGSWRAEKEDVLANLIDHTNNRSEEHTSELQSHSFISYAVF